MSDNRITQWFLAAVALVGLVYVCFELTPSSYGVFLESIQADDAGPVFGIGRPIRSDEWSIATPFFQAAVRNRFKRVNETSFYHEDLRNFIALPLKDWSLIFKPQLWAFFALPPALAFSIYYALFMCAFLAGFHLLFRELGMPAWLAAAASILVYFSGFTQFWWTTFCPLLGGLPWILLIVLRPMAWWKKVLLCAWAFPALVLSHAYPVLLMTLAWGSLVLILAFRPALLRSPGTIAAVAAGTLAAAIVVFVYYANVIPIMSKTVYPGHRNTPAGGTPMLAVLSEIFPFVSFRLSDYQHLDGDNICEMGALGSFLPLLTLCLTRFRSVRNHEAVRYALLVLLTGFFVITLWEIAPVPDWIGRILLWNRGDSERWLFTSGFLLMMAALVIWSNKLISVHPLRIGIFLLAGPMASVLLKLAWLIHKGESGGAAFAESHRDVFLCGLAIAAGVSAWYLPAGSRACLLLGTVLYINIYAFGRFNPLQPAWPIFDVPETDLVHDLREKAAASPGGILVDARGFGATLNGLGFRSVAHVQLAPNLAIFRSYFPAMDAERFNQIFNRYSHIQLTSKALPDTPKAVVIEVPIEVFLPARNVRRVDSGSPQAGACAQTTGGGIDRVSAEGGTVTIEGWAPWQSETDAQGIRILSARLLSLGKLATIPRPDIADRLQDYRFVKSGFKLQVSSQDGKPLRPEEMVIVAFGTAQGEIRLPCCGCP